ncbi:glycosyltransferase [Devosia sp. Root105]|uniref:glycosyltransferase n=1 Tax=Devosia sp. Root105 TaxID=1736423 RepID=UPI0006F35E2D|nr:glycosyltransferase [Devosia sp. Root105]
MAIVSSYSESCGNASFTKILHDTIRQYSGYEVEVVELDLPILQSIDTSIRAAATRHVDDLCRRLAQFDYVNIQLEAGLYGTLPGDIFQRLRKLMKANPNTSVTLHSPRIIPNPTAKRNAIKQLLSLRLKSALHSLMADYQAGIHTRLNSRLVRELARNGHTAIVHTERAKRQISTFFGYDNVYVHPLRLVQEGFQSSTATLDKVKANLNLEKGAVLIGMFGYISRNKGHFDALEALSQLPGNYKLAIFGRQHPQTIRSDGSKDDYLSALVQTVKNSRLLRGRVFFLGELSDDQFMQVASAVDVAWLPYYENGQDGSGIASITMDVCGRVLASASFAFDELMKLIPYNNVVRFDIGNDLELATKTQMIMSQAVPTKPFGDESTYNIRSQALAYVQASKARR